MLAHGRPPQVLHFVVGPVEVYVVDGGLVVFLWKVEGESDESVY